MPDSDRSFRRRASAPLGGRTDFRAGPRPESREPRFDQRLDQWLATGRQLVDGVAGARPGSRASGRPQPGGRAGGLPRPGGLGRWVEDKLDWLLEDDEGWREPWEGPAPGGRGGATEPPGGQSEVARGQSEPAFDPGPARDPWAPRSSRAPIDWRQDLEAPSRPALSQAPQPQQRRPLEALSRRATPLLPPRPQGADRFEPAGAGFPDWPDDASFTVDRWQRPGGPDSLAQAPLPLQPSLRPPGPGRSAQAFDPDLQADQPWRQSPPAAPPEAAPGRPVPRSTRRRPGP